MLLGRQCIANNGGRRESGGVAIRVALIVCTLAAVGGGIGFFLQQSRENQRLYQRKAIQICEFGLQRALEEISLNPNWTQGFERTEYDRGWYEVRVRTLSQGDTQRVEIESKGSMGTMTRKKTCRLVRATSAQDAPWIQEMTE